jgi:proteasome accessory factor C
VTLRLAPAAEWVVESHPYESATRHKDGSWAVVLAVSEPAWLERLLVSLGPDATVVAPPHLVDLGAAAAARLRARYAGT